MSPTATAVTERQAARVTASMGSPPAAPCIPRARDHRRVTVSRRTQLRAVSRTTPWRASLPRSAMWRRAAGTSGPARMSWGPV